jgi:hypothetical protein
MGTVYHISTDLQRHTATNKPWSEGISVTYTRRSETESSDSFAKHPGMGGHGIVKVVPRHQSLPAGALTACRSPSLVKSAMMDSPALGSGRSDPNLPASNDWARQRLDGEASAGCALRGQPHVRRLGAQFGCALQVLPACSSSDASPGAITLGTGNNNKRRELCR